MTEPPPRRVRVTNPRTAAAQYRARLGPAPQANTSGVDDVSIRALIRYQRGLALVFATGVALVLGALPVLFWLFPEAAAFRVAGVPVAWVVLGGVVYPFIVACGWFYLRRVERVEADYSQLVDRR